MVSPAICLSFRGVTEGYSGLSCNGPQRPQRVVISGERCYFDFHGIGLISLIQQVTKHFLVIRRGYAWSDPWVGSVSCTDLTRLFQGCVAACDLGKHHIFLFPVIQEHSFIPVFSYRADCLPLSFQILPQYQVHGEMYIGDSEQLLSIPQISFLLTKLNGYLWPYTGEKF